MDEFLVDVFDGSLFETDKIDELKRALWENARRLGMDAHLPDFQAGPWLDEQPWPTLDDIETLVQKSRGNQDFWNFMAANDARDEKHHNLQRTRDAMKRTERPKRQSRHAPKERAWYREIYNYYFVMLAIAAAKDMSQVNKWLLQSGRRRVSREFLDAALSEFYDGKTGPDSQSKTAPTFGGLLQAYRKHLKGHMPRDIVKLDAHRRAQITPSGWTCESFPDADAVADDFIDRVSDVTKHKTFSPQLHDSNRPHLIIPSAMLGGSQQSAPQNIVGGPQLSTGPAQQTLSNTSNDPVHVLRFNDASGQPQAYLVMTIFYRPVGWMDPQEREGDEFEKARDLVSRQIQAHNQGYADLETISQI